MLRQLTSRLRHLGDAIPFDIARQRRIRRIKNLIKTGQYHVSPLDVADAMLDGRWYEFESVIDSDGRRLDRLDLEERWDDEDEDPDRYGQTIRKWFNRSGEPHYRSDHEHRSRHPSAWRLEELPPPGELPPPR